jgi:hypothetical protein
MKTIKQFTVLTLITFLIWYLLIGFVRWDVSWMEIIPDMSRRMRMYFIGGLIVKFGLDVWLLSHIKERYLDKDLSAAKAEERAEADKLKKTFN